MVPKFSWVRNADQRPTDFWKVGFNDRGWNNLQVPAVWELNGYGDPIYVNTGYAGVISSRTTLLKFLQRTIM